MKNLSLRLCLSLLLLDFAASSQKPHEILPARCILLADPGPCKDQKVLVYGYDMYTNNCTSFMYGNCGGNPNRFATFKECIKWCQIKYHTSTTKKPKTTRKPQKTTTKDPDDDNDKQSREEH